MFVNTPTLEDLYPLAVSTKIQGRSLMYIEVERNWNVRFSRYVKLFDSIYGRVIKRTVNGATEVVALEVSVSDILCAKRRQVERGEEILATPLRANKLGGGAMPSTQR